MTTLLAVDDSSTMRKVLEITFAGEPYETLLVGSADEAMVKLDERQPPVALIDITLTPTDGYALCKRIKTESPQTRVVLLSSKQNPYDSDRGTEAGADDHIDKPFETQALIDKVARITGAEPAKSAAPVAIAKPAVKVVSPTATTTQPKSASPTKASPPLELKKRPTPAPSIEAAAKRASAQAPQRPPIKAKPEPVAPAAVQTITTPAPSAEAAAASPVATAINGSGLEGKLATLGLDESQVKAILSLSKEVVEQVVWEVVPQLAETLIKEEIARLTKA